MPETFGDELRAYLVDALYAHPAQDRHRSHWVMDAEWFAELRRMDDGVRRPLWEPSRTVTAPETLLGLPMEIRAGAGAPHLEQAGA